MNYTVEWTPTAEQQLAALWVNAPDRAAVTAATNAVDDILERDPLSVGESRDGNRRVILEAPLTVHYSVNEQSRHVTVWSVWHW